MRSQPVVSGADESALLWFSARALKHAGAFPPPDEAGIDWRNVETLAQKHRIAPLVWHNLAKGQGVDPPPSVVEGLRKTYRENAMHGMRVIGHLARIGEAFDRAGIALVPLKGVCLAARYYETVESRYAGDLDLLVAKEDLVAAHGTIRDLGYLRVSAKARRIVDHDFAESTDYRLHSSYISRDGLPIELHFQLHNNPAVLPVDVRDVVKAGTAVTLAGRRFSVLPDALEFAFLATHGARHEWVRLQWVHDIAVLLDSAEIDDVRGWLETARRYSVLNPAVQALILANRLYGSAIPDEALRAYAVSLRVRFMVKRAERAILRADNRRVDWPMTPFDPRRIYRMCVTAKPEYLWHEFRDGVRALSARLRKSAARL